MLQHLIVQHLGNTGMVNTRGKSSVQETVDYAIALINDADYTAHEGIVQQG